MKEHVTGPRTGLLSRLFGARPLARPRIGVVTDSAAALPEEWLSRDLIVVPIPVIIDQQVYAEDLEALLLGLAMGRSVKTSRPAPGEFVHAYNELAAAGCEQIISIHLSAALSGTYDAARLAAEQVSVPVTVIDSRTVALPLGFAVHDVLTARAAGAELEQLVALAENAAKNQVYFAVPSLDQLRRGGRISALSSVLGGLLNVKPILTIVEGGIQPLEKQRSNARAIARLVQLGRAAAANSERRDMVRIGVMHCGAAETASEIASELAEYCDTPVVIEVLPAVLAAHTGIGVVAVAITAHTPKPVAG